MSKRTAIILIPILALGLILGACNFPFLGGGAAGNPTPDLTLTALFLPLVSTSTPPPLPSATPTEVPSATPVPPTETPVPPYSHTDDHSHPAQPPGSAIERLAVRRTAR